MVYKFSDKKTSGGAVKSNIILNQELGEELHKPIRIVQSSFVDNIWGDGLADYNY